MKPCKALRAESARSAAFFLIVIISTLFLPGCAAIDKFLGAGKTAGADWKPLDKREALRLVKARQDAADDVSAKAHIDFKGSGYSAGGEASILLGGAGEFYFEFSGPFGADAIVASDGSILQAWDVRGRLMAVSSAETQTAILLDMPVSAKEITYILRAALPAGIDFEKRVSAFEFADGRKQINAAEGDKVYTIEFDASDKPIKYGVAKKGIIAVAAFYYKEAQCPQLPYTSVKIAAANAGEIFISLRDGSAKNKITAPKTAFKLNPPPFVKRIYGEIQLPLPKKSD